MKIRIQNKKLLLALIGGLVVIIVMLCSFLYYQVSLQPVTGESDIVDFEVVEGDSVSSVIDRLSQEDMIKNATVAKLYARMHGLNAVKAGHFQIDRAWDTGDILAYMNEAQNASAKQISVTIIEGMWAKDIAAEMEKKLNVKAADLLALWNDEAYLRTLIDRYEFLDDSILNEQTRVRLEGYLYPETYRFNVDATKEEITETFLNQFANVYKDLKPDIKADGRSVHDIITLASLVQYEAKTKEDMGMIAQVFANRLAVDMKLESSVTICYALYEEYENALDCEVNSDIDSPYNTYLHSGLPIGPILNPGADAINAVLHPTDNDYLYFMADIYGDGKVYYAKTLAEHEANVERYLR